ncbi:hypothetical protein PMI01_00397 [Caulobacter sp. AP07]|uniref:hypothetical protein n=1 Tax=Caulobacter sp. AP07 TaxID=1144304 RepID=UPI0002721AAE|nr:hypothetical protein [Caulobacter sp. AP07]EJL37943.1 hypothetical protein PMI01_00397 [Caulobacter sp. AP07]
MTLRHTLLGALAAGLTFSASAALAASFPACSHLRTQAPPSNPKDVFRTAVRVCDMPADCGMTPGKAGPAQPTAAAPPRG